MNHIIPYANELSKRGHSSTVVTEAGQAGASNDTEPPLYASVNYEEVYENKKLLFPNSRPADIIHAWTPRENVHKLVSSYQEKHKNCRLIVHLEDNEDSILESYYRCPIDQLRYPAPATKPIEWNPKLAHPIRYKRFLWKSDGITTINPNLSKLLPTPKPTINISPILTAENFKPTLTREETKKKFNLPSDAKFIVYPGGVTSNNREDIRNLYIAVKIANERAGPIYVIKTGPNCPDLEKSFSFDINSIRIDLGLVEREDIVNLYNISDLLVHPGGDSEFNRDRLPSKIPEFLMTGKPCIIPNIYRNALPYVDAKCFYVDGGNPQEISEACIRVLKELVLCKENVAEKTFRELYSSSKNVDLLLEFYDKINTCAEANLPSELDLDEGYRARFLKAHKTLKSTEQEVVKLNEDIHSFQIERTSLKEQLLQAHEENDRLSNKIERTNSSFSWKSTSPLRFLRRKIVDPWKKKNQVDKTPNTNKTEEAEKCYPRINHPCYHKDYHKFVENDSIILPQRIQKIKSQLSQLQDLPKLSILLPTYNVDAIWLEKCIESVTIQIYANWELCIADDASTKPHVREVIDRYLQNDSRIKAAFRAKNGHISAASNTASELATGDYLVLLDHDDTIPPHALSRVAIEISNHPGAKLIYSDEDKIDEDDVRHDPHFKTDWNYDFFLGCNMISHLGVYKRSIFEEVGRFREGFEGAQDWDLALRVIEKCEPNEIRHIPEILYHWRSIDGSTAANLGYKNYAYIAQRKAIRSHLERIQIKANVESVQGVNWRIAYHLPNPAPKVSIIIPTRNQVGHLQKCVESIINKTCYPNFDVLIVDNDSDDPETLFYLEHCQEDERIRVIKLSGDFNYSRLNNEAILQTHASFICLLNNDTEVVDGNWLNELVRHGTREEIGIVGAKLLYPHDHIQHCGIILGIYDIAGHAFKFLHKDDNGHIGRAKLVSRFSAVTGACMLFRKSLWKQIGGLDEKNLPISYNDVDFCLRAREAGFATIVTPFATLYHKESISRGEEQRDEDILRFEGECQYMRTKWKSAIENDPYYNPNLSRAREDFSYRFEC